MLTALRDLSVLDRHYHRGDTVDTRDLPQRRVNQLKRYGMVKEFSDAENVTTLIERMFALEARVAELEGRKQAEPAEQAVAAVETPPPPAGQPIKIKRGGVPKDRED